MAERASLDPALAAATGHPSATATHHTIRLKQNAVPGSNLDSRPRVPSRALTDDERNKLELVLDSIDPCNAMSAEVSVRAAAPVSMRSAIRDKSCSIASIKDVASVVFTTYGARPASQDSNAAVVEFERIVLALLDELESRGQPRSATKREATTEADLTPRPTKKFMLHRGVGDVDIFSSATELSNQEFAMLAQSQDTDVIHLLSSTSVFAEPEGKEATLGASVSRPKRPILSGPAEPRPVEFLYYDPFQSFAPSYDSSPATLGSVQSVAQRRSKARLEEWDESLRSDEPDASTTRATRSLSLSREDEQVLTQSGIDSQALLSNVNLAQEDETSRKLSESGKLLTRLIKARLVRTRDGNNVVGESENRDASQVVSTFVDLLSLRPKPRLVVGTTADASSSSSSSFSKAHARALSIVPPKEAVRSSMSRIHQSMSRDSVYYGTLEQGNAVAVKSSEMERK
ncbi:hypothetical protein ACM66B_002621 [Microbotryomycetes sp. NB124-2]